VDRAQLVAHLKSRPEVLKSTELLGPNGQVDSAKSKKLQEVAGFCEVILRYVRKFLIHAEPVRILECSCGKSYLGVLLCLLLEEFEGKRGVLTGLDINEELIRKCRSVAGALNLEGARFVVSRILDFESDEEFDLLVALHACDTATDEAIAKGIRLSVPLILAVPCCQNQIRGQITGDHPLKGITEFGPARYRLANVLTDALRAQFLRGAGYHVEMDEIVSPRVTPKNLCICARKVKGRSSRRRDVQYRALRDLFAVKPRLESYCPGIVDRPPQPGRRGSAQRSCNEIG